MIEDAEDEGFVFDDVDGQNELEDDVGLCPPSPLSPRSQRDECFAVVKLAENEADEIEDEICDIKVWEDDDAIVSVQLDGFAVRNVREGVVSEDLQDDPDELDGLDGI